MKDSLHLVGLEREKPVTRLMHKRLLEEKIAKSQVVLNKSGISGWRTLLLMAVTAGASIWGTLAYKNNETEYYKQQMIAQAESHEQKVSNLRATLYSGEEIDRYIALKKELSEQITDTKKFCSKIADYEVSFANLVDFSKNYIEISRPQGELEESFEQEIQVMQGFFDNYSTDAIMKPIMEGYAIAEQVEKQSPTEKQKLWQMVDNLNTHYISTLNKTKQDSASIIENLTNFKAYAERYPLKQRKAMVERIDQEIELRQGVIEEADTYMQIFADNSTIDDILPVNVRQGKL